jgi:hypothetical protein
MSEEKQDGFPGFKSDPAKYRKMSEPHASMEAINEDLCAFQVAVGALREKHKLRDVIVCLQASYLTSDGEEVDGGIHFGFGNAMNHEMLLAHTLGMVQADRQEMLAKFVRKGIRAGSRKD